MIKKWLRVPNKRKIIIARQKRDRRPLYGMLVQFNGSYHDWLENWEKWCLLVAIDDATSPVIDAKFTKWESLDDVFNFWKDYFKKYSKPQAIYIDCYWSYKGNYPQDQFDYEIKTRFQRAMETPGVVVIYSKHPEGK